MTKRLVIILAIQLFILSGCSSPQPAAPPQPEFRPTATIKDIMDSIVDPNADEVWGSVAFSVDATGTHDRSPKTDEDWKMVRRHVISLLEATNLLLVPGRQVAKPHEKSENPGIELEPEQMEKLISDDRQSFTKLAHGLHDAVMIALKAVDEKNTEGLLDSGDAIDQACENCHLKYWYPNEAKAQEEQRKAPAPPQKEGSKN